MSMEDKQQQPTVLTPLLLEVEHFYALDSRTRRVLDKIGKAADRLGLVAYAVGGFVRDVVLGRPLKDIDIVTVGSGIALAEAVRKWYAKDSSLVVYRKFGTARIYMEGYEIEFVGARKESYRHDSRKPQVEQGTLEDDQLRRDFTINALYYVLNGPDKGKLIDPFGGMRDIELKIIRTPTDPARTFSDDPLRMLRAIRFAVQLGFTIHPRTKEGILQSAHRIEIVSAERISDELQKIMRTDKPSRGFMLMDELGLLQYILPELQALKGVEWREGIGHKDNFYHSLKVLDNVAARTKNEPDKKLWLRWAALLHDIGKAPTKRFHPKEGWTFHGHEVVGARMVKTVFKRLRLPLDSRFKYVQKLVRHHLRPISLTKEDITDSAIRRLIFDMGDDLEDLLLLCEADITSKNPHKVRRYLDNYRIVRQRIKEVEEKDRIRNWQPPIDGEEIMRTFGIPPSKPVGIIKNAIKDAILDGVIPNTYEAARAFMLEKGRSLGLTPVTEEE